MPTFSTKRLLEFFRETSRQRLKETMPSDYTLFDQEITYINHVRAKIIGVVCFLLIGALTVLDIYNYLAGLWDRQQGYRFLFYSHCLLLAVFAAFFIFDRKRPLDAPSAAGSVHTAAIHGTIFLAMASITLISISDVLVNGSIAAYLGTVFAVASIFLFFNTACWALFLSNMALMLILLVTVLPAQFNAVRIQMINVVVFTLIAASLSRIIFYYHVKDFKNKALIDQQRRQLEKMSMRDHLTQAANRRYFQEVSSAEIDRANRYGTLLSIAIFDLDHFKSINDTYGHNMGDAVLIEISKIVSKNKRKSDLFARWGGEEFLLLSPQTDLAGMVAMAEKLRSTIEASTFSHGGRLTTSFGVTQYRPGETLEEFINRSDRALYRAKNMGRNRVATLDEGRFPASPLTAS